MALIDASRSIGADAMVNPITAGIPVKRLPNFSRMTGVSSVTSSVKRRERALEIAAASPRRKAW
jgi:hypothetical protein